ncbi:MAG: DUF1588 domain-containing protein [Polyangiales bacterium]
MISLAGCTGSVAGDGSESTTGARTPGDPGGAPSDEVAIEPLRRLTHDEYRATLDDLFGFESAVAKRLPSEGTLHGLVNDSSAQWVTPPLTQIYAATSREMAELATVDLPAFLGCDPTGDAERACIEHFVDHFGLRAFRRPLGADERERYLGLYETFRETGDVRAGVGAVTSAMLQSPKFLFRTELGGGDAHLGGDGSLSAHELASRMSYLLWGTMPDARLFEAAADGSLLDPATLEAETLRLWGDERSGEIAWRFISDWFDLDRVETLRPTSDVYANYRVYLQGIALEESARAFVKYIFNEEGARLDALLTTPTSFVGSRIKTIYNVDAIGGGPNRFDTDPAQRSGILTHALWLATFSQPTQTDPIARGRFVREELLCEPLPALPTDVVPLPPEASTAPTARERYTMHAEDENCAGCHALMDPIGFAFERHDAIGRWRDTENGAPIDTSGSLTKANGEVITFADARELTEKLADDDQVADCAVRQWFRFAFGRRESTDDETTLTELRTAFDAEDRSFHALVRATVASRAFHTKTFAGGSTP